MNPKKLTLFFSLAFSLASQLFPNSLPPHHSCLLQDLSDEFPKDYRNWAAVLSQVLLKKEGSLETAAKVLQRVMLATHGHLSKVVDGEDFFPRFHLQDPVLTADASSAVNGVSSGLPPLPKVEGTMFSSGATFFNYAPCVLSESYTGANAALTGLNFAPTLLSVRSGTRRGRENEIESTEKSERDGRKLHADPEKKTKTKNSSAPSGSRPTSPR